MNFTVSLAGVNIGISSIYDTVYNMCAGYLTDYAADFSVKTTPSDIDFERIKAIDEAKHEGRVCPDFPEGYLETLAVYRKIAVKLLDYGAFLIHGVALGLDGEAYLFTAPSGVGKTTHSRFWCETYPNAFVINGDKPIIKVDENGVFVCGTPWSGKEGLNTNVILPLKSVCLLFRGKENEIKEVGFGSVFPLIIGQTYRPEDAESMQKTLELIKKASENIRFFALHCNLDPDAARVAKEGMNKNEQRRDGSC